MGHYYTDAMKAWLGGYEPSASKPTPAEENSRLRSAQGIKGGAVIASRIVHVAPKKCQIGSLKAETHEERGRRQAKKKASI